ncbi:MAG: carbohydrate ABC transporter permease [Lachnospiraceae bacterium]|nr:carbohydrate ABC transporter permease [Lachnospiraceae bacterium]
MEKAKKSYFQKNWWKHILQVFIIGIYLVPFYVIIVMSLKSISDKSSRLSLPERLYLDNYASVFQSGMMQAILNSIIITVSVVLIEIIVGCMAAYPLARNQSKGNRAIGNIFLGVMMIPGLAVLVGVYSLLAEVGGINTYWGIILSNVGFGLPTAIYLYQNFIVSIPKELDEAACIDGAGAFRTFWHIILPQLKPVTVTVIILNGIGIWNEYMYSLYILQRSEMFTVTLKINAYFSAAKQDYGGAAAAAVVGMLPIVIMYLFLQKYFIKGVVDSAVKG